MMARPLRKTPHVVAQLPLSPSCQGARRFLRIWKEANKLPCWLLPASKSSAAACHCEHTSPSFLRSTRDEVDGSPTLSSIVQRRWSDPHTHDGIFFLAKMDSPNRTARRSAVQAPHCTTHTHTIGTPHSTVQCRHRTAREGQSKSYGKRCIAQSTCRLCQTNCLR